ncbi:MAG: CopG family transcriptional regulator [Promethearchaeota archaeon]|nr:MAG: CopG family transcriptional regulator [Candidatus Lokiarchaeota archaeon]
MPKYRTIRVPEELVKTVLNFIEEYKELGYRSHSEFIIDATRRRIEKLMSSKLFNRS